MGNPTPNWVWFLDQDLVDTCLRADPAPSGLARRAATHPAVVESVRRQIAGDPQGAAQVLEPALALGNPDALLLAGQLSFESERFDQAARYYSQIAQSQPDHPFASYNQAVSLGRSRDFPGALEALQRAVVLDPSRPQAWFVLGVCLLHASRPAEARSAFRHSLELRPLYAPAMFGEAVALHLEGKAGEAVKAYERLLETRPEEEAILENALSAAITSLDDRSVRRFAEQIHRVNAHSVPALAALAVAELDAGNPEAATRWLTALAESRPDCFEGWYNLGVAFSHNGDWLRAAQAFETALQLQPADAQALDGCSRAWMEAGELEKARALCQQLVQLEHLSSPSQAIHAWFRLGSLHHAAGDPEQAAEAFRHAVDQEPLWTEAWCNLASCLQVSGQPEAAVEAWQQALARDPDCRPAHLGLARVAVCSDDFASAERHYEAAATLDAAVSFALGLHDQNCGHAAQARRHYEQALEADPECAAAHWNLGHVLFEMGDKANGPGHWRTALELDPSIAKSI